MEVAVRLSTSFSSDAKRLLIADVSGNSIQYCEIESDSPDKVKYRRLCQRDHLPNFTAFDWSRYDEGLVAIGTAAGESKVMRLEAQKLPFDFVHSFPIKLQRKCNSIAFSGKDLLAAGLDRARNDSSLNLYDIRTSSATPNAEPYRRLSTSEVVTNVKFFHDQPDVLLAGVSRQCIRLYDLRESAAASATQLQTRQVHFISIDPLDENSFVSASSSGENVISVWDRRFFARSVAQALPDTTSQSSLLDIRPSIDASRGASIWSLRYSGHEKGRFAALSSTGQIRLFHVSKYAAGSDLEQKPQKYPAGVHPDPVHFIRKSQNLQYPWHDSRFGHEESTRAIAFDFAPAGSIDDDPCLLTIRQNRDPEQNRIMELVKIPREPALVHLNPANNMFINCARDHYFALPTRQGNIAEDRATIRRRTITEAGRDHRKDMVGNVETLPMLQRDEFRHQLDSNVETTAYSTHGCHEQLSSSEAKQSNSTVNDALTMLETQKRRCEEGYLFDCEINKGIVKDDPQLVTLWDVVKKMELISRNDGMIHEAYDLSFLGVYGIWSENVGATSLSRVPGKPPPNNPNFSTAIDVILFRQGYEDFQGVETQFPAHRQLGLVLCGWRFEESRLRAKCSEILSRREYYKAIVVAVCHGRKDIAIDLLRSLTKTKVIENSAIGAVIACETVSPEQRSMCEWMAEEAEDPYLRALLAYFVSADWHTVVEMSELPLLYRVAIALKYVDDSRLDTFLRLSTKQVIERGDAAGILLTGLTEYCIELFQNYIVRSNDVQTAVLATALVVPRYFSSSRWEVWKNSYFASMQSWKAFLERTRFTVQHSRRAVSREGKRLIQPSPRQITIRCNHCQSSVVRGDLDPEIVQGSAPFTASAASRFKTSRPGEGTNCPRCGRHMPRCSICLIWLGTPEPSKHLPGLALGGEELMAKFISFCMSCNHAHHAHHAREWFVKHQICPVPDCQCVCTLSSSV